MKEIKTDIIPVTPFVVRINGVKKEPDLKAICLFAATGFFLDQDTYWKDEKVLRPGTMNKVDSNGCLAESKSWFDWYHEPKNLSFEQTLLEFSDLFENIIKDQIGDSSVILPLSGGLDSRSQALVLSRMNNSITSYSYSFYGGYSEAKIAREVARVCNFPFQEFKIPQGYLWNDIEELAGINQCRSEFTHPRQMAVLPELKNMEGIFSLGHWGDVFFDRGAPTTLQEGDQLSYVLKSVVKKSGMELATSLWTAWGLPGRFEDYIKERICDLLSTIDIKNLSARLRAFKSLYWAPRWTSTNLSVFKQAHPITLPHYDNRMCKFICEIPETYLADRKLQLAYLKQHKPLANITWEAHKPFNLYNYKYDKIPYNLPYRIFKKVERETAALRGKKYIQRNWELQFLGKRNEENLKNYLFEPSFNQLVPKTLVESFLKNFKNKGEVKYSHSVSTLLTLSLWNKNQKYGPAD